jgi:excisionase family DNA binding protein
MEKRLLTVNELSNYLSLPKGSIYTMVCLKKIPGVIRIGRALRFEKIKIDTWINSKTVSQPSAQERKLYDL